MEIIATSTDQIIPLFERQKDFFRTGKTKPIAFRKQQLLALKEAIRQNEEKIQQALWQDLHKSPEESYLTEISIVLSEVDNHIRHLKKWSRPKRVSTPVHLMFSKSRIIYEPLGVALVVAPWNYPFQLLFNPLIGAISAGCCCILKPSPYAPATAWVMQDIIRQVFKEEYIGVTQGGKEVNTALFQLPFDFIFFTGSPELGKVVMKAASEHLTPVVLELGGKSPCIVDKDADLNIAAKRITWGKLINAGQTCIAPDYLFVHESVKEELLQKMIAHIGNMYGGEIKESRYYPRIVSDKAMMRLEVLLKGGKIRFGGEVDAPQRYIPPTIIDQVKPDDPVMQEEIFGPILPVMTFTHIEEVTDYVNRHEKPLAFYYFGNAGKGKEIIGKTTSGGACINDTLMHITNHHLPFGGVGNSGMGKYHGRDSFLAFSNARALIDSPTWWDISAKYAPFKHFNRIKKML